MVPLSDIRAIASRIGAPTDKACLIRWLAKAGAIGRDGRVKGGQLGKVYVPDRLPERVRSALRAREAEPPIASADPAIVDRYMRARPSLREEADRQHNMMWRVRRLVHGGLTERQALIAASDEFGKSLSAAKAAWRTIRNRPDAEWLDALVPAYKGRAKAPVDERIVRSFIADFGRVEQPQAQACYERTCRAAKAGGWGPVPSLKTLQRRFEELPADVKTLLRKGERSLLDSLPHQERDRSGMLPLDSINMDSRTWDVFVQLDDGRVIRPTVTMAQDEATNFILAFETTETETGASYRRVLCSAFTRWGIPDKARFDNTHAAANKALTAGAQGRHRFKDDGAVEGLLQRLMCTVAFTEPYNGRAKLMERALADLKERTERDPRLAGAYTGRSPTEKPANYGERAVPLSLFMQVLAEGVEEYNTRTGRRSTVAWKTSYQAVFEAGLKKKAVRRLTEAQRRLFFLTAERRTVTAGGSVSLGKGPRPHRYGDNEALRNHAGREIVVRYDENDMAAPILAETLDGTLISEAVRRIAAGAFNSAEAANAHRRARKAAARAAKEHVSQLGLADAIEAGEVTPIVASPPAKPTADVRVVQGVFASGPHPRRPRGSRPTRSIGAPWPPLKSSSNPVVGERPDEGGAEADGTRPGSFLPPPHWRCGNGRSRGYEDGGRPSTND